MDFKEALKNSVKLLLGGIQNDKLVNMDKLKGDERVDLVNTVSLIMPQVYFCTSYDRFELREQYVRRSCQTEAQILDAAIHSYFEKPVELQFYSIFKQRFLIAPE